MSVSLDIVPLSDSLNMYGTADPSSAYSLSGHVSISLKSPLSIFEPRRTASLLLQSLEITFEGQSELVSPKTGHTPLRLCSISRELAPSHPVEITNRGHEDSDRPCTWNVVFNIPIPGWLPSTCHFGHPQGAGTIYTLFATAKFVNLEGPSTSGCSFATLCSPFRSKTKYAHAQKAVTVARFINPPAVPSSSKSVFPTMTYGVDPQPAQLDKRDSLRIPADVLSKIRVLVSVPECVSMDEESLPFTIRLHSDLDSAARKRLQVTEFSLKIIQTEKYLHSPSAEYRARYPLPPASSQPPNKPLLRPNSVSSIYDLGLYFPSSHNTRHFSLLPTTESGVYVISGDTYIFAPQASDATPAWFSMETSVPFVHQQVAKERQWAGELKLRPSSSSPLFTVRHELCISLSCRYDMPGCETKAAECLHFSLPLHFVRTPASPPSPTTHISASAPLPANDVLTTSAPPALSLPAYSQLFDYNGDRKIDYSVQLPPYSPPVPATSSSSSSLSPELEARSLKTKTLDRVDEEADFLS